MNVKRNTKKWFQAVKDNDIEKLKKLLNKGIDPNIKDERGYTALMLQTKHNYFETVKLLLDYHADPNIQNVYGDTALKIFSKFGDTETVNLLLDHHADPNIRDYDGGSALREAVMRGYAEIIEKLLPYEKDSSYCCQLLMYVPGKGSRISSIGSHIIDLILNKIKELGGNSKSLGYVLVRASDFGYYDIVERVLDEGVDVNATDADGDTALILAVQGKHIETIKLLLSKGANPNIRNKAGKCALDFVSSKKDGDDMICMEMIGLLTKDNKLMGLVDQFKEFKRTNKWNNNAVSENMEDEESEETTDDLNS